MKKFSCAIALCLSAAANAQTQPEWAPDQMGYVAYDQCLMHAAMQASKTDAKDAAIYSIAKAQCAPTRASVVVGQEANKAYLAALDTVDAEKEANFPTWINGARERRRLREVQFATPPSQVPAGK